MSDQAEPGTVGSVTREAAQPFTQPFTQPSAQGDDPSRSGGEAAQDAGIPAAAQEPAPFVSQTPGTPVVFPSFHGRKVSWVAVSVVMAGFVAGGLGLILGPTWWAFWMGLGLAIAGGLVALATNIFEDWY